MITDVEFASVPTYLDDRGYLCVLFDRLQLPNTRYPKIDRVYFVGNFAQGTVRAFHKHRQNWDCFFISSGAAKFVLVDDREKSPTFKQSEEYVLSRVNPAVLVVPPEVWHGWMSLEDNTHLVNLASESLDKARPDEERIPPDTFGEVWKVKNR